MNTNNTTTIKWYGKEVEKQIHSITEKALLTGGHLIEGDAKQLCPADSGRLRSSISVNWTNSGRPSAVVRSPAKEGDGVSMPDTKKDEFTVHIGTNVEYAIYVEYGTGIFAEGGKGRQTPWVYKTKKGFFFTRGNPPQPFLRPAYEKNISKIKALYQDSLKELK
jgi:HK97 gp10 family phage protein